MKDLIDKLNLKEKHISLKIDVEGSEWAGFRTLPFEYLDNIDHIVMEFHNPYFDVVYPAFWGNLDTLESLF